MFCSFCGHKLKDGLNFCDECGSQVAESASDAPSAPAQNNAGFQPSAQANYSYPPVNNPPQQSYVYGCGYGANTYASAYNATAGAAQYAPEAPEQQPVIAPVQQQPAPGQQTAPQQPVIAPGQPYVQQYNPPAAQNQNPQGYNQYNNPHGNPYNAPYANPYNPYGYQQGGAAAKPCVAGLVLGIVSLVLFAFGFVHIIAAALLLGASIFALVLGVKAKKNNSRLGTAALILGIIGVVLNSVSTLVMLSYGSYFLF
ncbi:MAG: hypothetical protein LBS99_02640 [Clostridiales bacterium]|jgi:hypothetical protein|nr:hypothetical protein [Clostridiales bacterium]